MAWAYIQGAKFGVNAASSTLQVPANLTSGNGQILGIMTNSAISSVTDDKSQTWTQRFDQVNGSSHLYLYTAPVTSGAAGTRPIVTVTQASSGFMSAGQGEFSGLDAALAVDVTTVGANSAASSITVTTAAASATGELCVSVATIIGGQVITRDAALTDFQYQDVNPGICMPFSLAGKSSTASSTFSFTDTCGSNDTWLGIAAVFALASAGAAAGAVWDPRSAARLWHPGAPGSFLLPIWSVSPAATADISVTAACGVGVATMGFDAHDVTAVASGQAAAGGAGTVTRDISSAAGEQVAVAPRGTVTIDYGATVASEQVAVGGVATPGHDVTATGAEAVAVAETATIAHGVTTVASEAAGAAVTATATTGLTAVASEQAAASLAATVTRDLTGLATEGIAVGGTATTSGVSDVSVFARTGIAAGGTGTITTTRTAAASASAGASPVAAITTGITAAARLDAATSISAAVIIGLALTAIARAATGGTATVTIQSILPLPPLIPPFAAVIDAYSTSTVSTTPTTSTVNTTPVGVT